MSARQCEPYRVDSMLDPHNALPNMVKKSDVVEWELALKDQLCKWMKDFRSPFTLVQRDLETNAAGVSSTQQNWIETTFPLLNDLRSHGALPAIVFHYDRVGCELILSAVMEALDNAETRYRKSEEWAKKMQEFQDYKEKKLLESKSKPSVNTREDKDDGTAFDRLDYLREEASKGISLWDSFDPDAPIDRFSFADSSKITKVELEKLFASLKYAVKKPFLDALRRGLGVHHAGMNRRYRQA